MQRVRAIKEKYINKDLNIYNICNKYNKCNNGNNIYFIAISSLIATIYGASLGRGDVRKGKKNKVVFRCIRGMQMHV